MWNDFTQNENGPVEESGERQCARTLVVALFSLVSLVYVLFRIIGRLRVSAEWKHGLSARLVQFVTMPRFCPFPNEFETNSYKEGCLANLISFLRDLPDERQCFHFYAFISNNPKSSIRLLLISILVSILYKFIAPSSSFLIKNNSNDLELDRESRAILSRVRVEYFDRADD